MTWNWQQNDWPHFSWDAARLVRAEREFLIGGGILLGATRHLKDAERDLLAVELMSSEALTTSEIEGEILDRDSVQSSIQKYLGLAADDRLASPAAQGVAAMTVRAIQTFGEPLAEETLGSWHALVTQGRTDLDDIGRYRTHPEPMQIVSTRQDKPKVYFQAPPSAHVSSEMVRYLKWFNASEDTLPALTRAGLAHLYFESIHPYEDGNGRVGRAIASKALSQGIGEPSFVSLSSTLLAHRREYYAALAAASTSNEVTDWLAWFAGIVLEAQRRTLVQCLFTLSKARMLDRLRGTLNARQEKVLLRMFREGADGFAGGLSAGNYAKITGAAPATRTRDLADLVAKGALRKTGELRHTRYFLDVPLTPPARVTITKQGDVVGNRSVA